MADRLNSLPDYHDDTTARCTSILSSSPTHPHWLIVTSFWFPSQTSTRTHDARAFFFWSFSSTPTCASRTFYLPPPKTSTQTHEAFYGRFRSSTPHARVRWILDSILLPGNHASTWEVMTIILDLPRHPNHWTPFMYPVLSPKDTYLESSDGFLVPTPQTHMDHPVEGFVSSTVEGSRSDKCKEGMNSVSKTHSNRIADLFVPALHRPTTST